MERKEILSLICKEFVCETKQARDIFHALLSFDGLNRELSINPINVIKYIANSQLESSELFYPCYTIELRQILLYNTIYHPRKIACFSFDIIRKYLTLYPLVLVIRKEKTDGDVINNSIFIIKDNKWNIADKILRIQIRDKALSPEEIEAINKIVEEENPRLDIGLLDDIPALRRPGMERRTETKSFNLSKTADASSGADSSGFSGNAEGADQTDQHQGILNVKYETISPFQKGDKVRFRPAGFGFGQITGEVVSVTNNKLVVEWLNGKKKGKRTQFDLLDTVRLSISLELIA